MLALLLQSNNVKYKCCSFNFAKSKKKIKKKEKKYFAENLPC